MHITRLLTQRCTSKDDIALTKRIKKCEDMMGIDFIDHIIVGGDDCYSFNEGGFL